MARSILVGITVFVVVLVVGSVIGIPLGAKSLASGLWVVALLALVIGIAAAMWSRRRAGGG